MQTIIIDKIGKRLCRYTPAALCLLLVMACKNPLIQNLADQKTNAQKPTISSLEDASYIFGETAAALVVKAKVPEGNLSYQWYSSTNASNSGGTLIDKATDASWTPPTDALGTLYYYCVVTNTLSASYKVGNLQAQSTSNAAAITVTAIPAPLIKTQPQGASYTIGETAAALTVAATVSQGVLSYQWWSNTSNSNSGGTAIPTATHASYTPPTGTTGTIYYYCVVTSTLAGKTASTSSNAAVVQVTGFKVIYDANTEHYPGAACTVTDSTAYAPGDTPTVKAWDGTLPNSGKIFYQWNTQADGNGTYYAANAVLPALTGDLTLYASYSISGSKLVFQPSDLASFDPAKSYTLMADLTTTGGGALDGVNGGATLPLANSGTSYSGTFDGNGHTIDITDNPTMTNANRVGLFSSVNGGTIENLTVTGTLTQTNGYENCGLVAEAKGATRLDKITSHLTIVTNGNHNGGVAGHVEEDVVITACQADGTITATLGSDNSYTGGIAGYTYSGGSGVISGCKFTGTITGTNEATGYSQNEMDLGGIVGKPGGTVTNCYSSGFVSGTGKNTGMIHAGGISGHNGNLSYCYSTAAISVTGTTTNETSVGGIMGFSDGGPARHCVALNSSISNTVHNTDPYSTPYKGRIQGKDAGWTGSDNYASVSGFTINSPGTSNTNTGIDGADFASWTAVGWTFGGASSTDGWKGAAGDYSATNTPKLWWE
jgi:hypothetical protein